MLGIRGGRRAGPLIALLVVIEIMLVIIRVMIKMELLVFSERILLLLVLVLVVIMIMPFLSSPPICSRYHIHPRYHHLQK